MQSSNAFFGTRVDDNDSFFWANATGIIQSRHQPECPLSAQNSMTQRFTISSILFTVALMASAPIAGTAMPRGNAGAATAAFTLAGRDAWRQLLVAGQSSDLSRTATCAAEPAGIVHMGFSTGLVTPIKDGKAAIIVTAGAHTPSRSMHGHACRRGFADQFRQ